MIYMGIDVSKHKLDCGWIRDPQRGKVKTRAFPNKPDGFQALLAWACKQAGAEPDELHFVLEATGIYHEALAHALFEAGACVSVVNPAHVRHFAQSEGARSKTDRRDSLVLARFGMACQPRPWQPEPKEIRVLKALINRLSALEKDIQRERNRLEKAETARQGEEVLASIRTMLEHLEAEHARLRGEIDRHIDKHPQLREDRKLLKSISGIGEVMSRMMVVVLRSRNFRSAKTLDAYVGLAPVHHQSGTKTGHSSISKAGDGRLRARLYMATVSAVQHNPIIREHYQRLLQRGKPKMVALVACMRKLLHICFGVFKHRQKFQTNLLQTGVASG